MLTIENLTMKFGGVTALDNISMHVAPGTIHGIIGPNGSGKTTLFNCVSGIYKPTSGKIIFNGNQDITGMEPHKVTKSGIARTFQMLRIFPSLSVLDNLILAQALFEKSTMLDAMLCTPRCKSELKSMEGRAFEMLKTIGLEKKAYNSAEGISIGQRRVLQLGIGAINNPKLLLLDEPSLGLAPNLVQLIFDLIRDINRQGVTILLIEQNANMALKVADYGYVLETGRITLHGPAKELRSNEEVKRAYLGNAHS